MSIEGVVLAAGPSKRFAASVTEPGAPRLKQLLDFGGEPLVRRIVRAARRSRLARLVVVVGFESERVGAAVADLGVTIVDSPDWATGQSASVRAGLAAVGAEAEGALFLPCDQPFLDAGTIDLLIARRERGGAAIVRPAFARRAGAPVLFGRELFAELATITGDEGGRQLFADHADSLDEVELEGPLPLADVDSWRDYEALRAKLS